jgi:hypothetical protein
LSAFVSIAIICYHFHGHAALLDAGTGMVYHCSNQFAKTHLLGLLIPKSEVESMLN